jgi:hypothetical protein
MVFGKLIKKLQISYVYYDAVAEAFGDATLKLTQISPFVASPGDILTFSCNKKFRSRKFLVVSTDRAPGGGFVSSKGNYLICGYDLTNKETLPGLVMVFNSFFKQSNSTYKILRKLMDKLFGGDNYKTFNSQNMSGIYSIEVTSKK